MKTYFQITLLAIMILLVLPFTVHGSACKGASGSQEEDSITVKLGTSNRNRTKIQDITKTQIKWTPELDNQNGIPFDISKVMVKYRTESDDWKTHSEPSTLGRRSYKWTIPRIPCMKYEYQVVAPPNSAISTGCSFSSNIIPLPPSNTSTIRNFNYQPEVLTDLGFNSGPKDVKFEWKKSPCAEEYAVYIEQAADESMWKHKTVAQRKDTKRPSVSFDNLIPCTGYAFQIFGKMKNAAEKKAYQSIFNTKPARNSAEELNLTDVSSGKNSINFKFDTNKPTLNCFKKFSIQTCNKKGCLKNTQRTFFQNIESTAKGLKHCTNYRVKVKPIYQNVDTGEKIIDVTTKFDKNATKFDVDIEEDVDIEHPGHRMARVSVDNVDCFDNYTISYRLDKKGSGGEFKGSGKRGNANTENVNGFGTEGQIDGWITETRQMNGGEFHINNLKRHSTYLLNMTVHLSEKMLDSQSSKKTLPIITLKSFKTNQSNVNMASNPVVFVSMLLFYFIPSFCSMN